MFLDDPDTPPPFVNRHVIGRNIQRLQACCHSLHYSLEINSVLFNSQNMIEK